MTINDWLVLLSQAPILTPTNIAPKRSVSYIVESFAFSDTIVTLPPVKSSIVKVELVTTLKRQATKILADLHSSKEPVLITEHGQPSAYLVDVDDFEMMQKRMSILEGIARGEQAIRNEQVVSNTQAKEQMDKWLK